MTCINKRLLKHSLLSFRAKNTQNQKNIKIHFTKSQNISSSFYRILCFNIFYVFGTNFDWYISKNICSSFCIHNKCFLFNSIRIRLNSICFVCIEYIYNTKHYRCCFRCLCLSATALFICSLFKKKLFSFLLLFYFIFFPLYLFIHLSLNVFVLCKCFSYKYMYSKFFHEFFSSIAMLLPPPHINQSFVSHSSICN